MIYDSGTGKKERKKPKSDGLHNQIIKGKRVVVVIKYLIRK